MNCYTSLFHPVFSLSFLIREAFSDFSYERHLHNKD